MLTPDELRVLHAARDWRVLWQAAIPIVKHAVTKLLRSGQLSTDSATDDLLQEGYLAAGPAIKSWNPDAGMFSTWISHAVRGAMLDHLRRECSGMVGGRDSGRRTTVMEDDIAMDTEAVTPAAETERSNDALRVRVALASLGAREQLIVKRWFGIDCEPESLDQICMIAGLKRVQVWRVIKNTLSKMKQMV